MKLVNLVPCRSVVKNKQPPPYEIQQTSIYVKYNMKILYNATIRRSVMSGELGEDHIVLDLSEIHEGFLAL